MSFLQNEVHSTVDWHTFKSLKRQTVDNVVDFSSQYGRDFSSSYIVGNIVGEPSNYPGYGDFTQALVFRTYGKWWMQSPSRRKPLKQSISGFNSHDFIDVMFADPVFPTQVEVYETYNPGAVIRILACNYDHENDKRFSSRWFVLWCGDKQMCPPEFRIFSPTLQRCPFKTRQLRIEFDQTHLEYYTELDAVVLYGLDSEEEYMEVERKDKKVQIMINSEELSNDTKLAKLLASQMTTNHYQNCHTGNDMDGPGLILALPSEVINKVFSYLSFHDLGKVAMTCKFLKKYTYDPLWFKEFDLQPHWPKMSDAHLRLLSGRCSSVKRLNLSWCGPGKLISPIGFTNFLQSTNGGLRCLYLSACRFLNENSLFLIKEYCPVLEELDLSSCVDIPSESFSAVSCLTCLTRLNLYRTQIRNDELSDILRCCTKLKHLNLGACRLTTDYTTCFGALQNCPNLISLDLWRTKHLSSAVIQLIAENCRELEEIDLGWCWASTLESEPWVSHLASRCHKLKKLFLTAIRSVTSLDLIAIAEHCPLMEQLDILGTSQVSKVSVEWVLRECKRLRFFDISFCSQLDNEWFEDVRLRYPNVSLKKSVN